MKKLILGMMAVAALFVSCNDTNSNDEIQPSESGINVVLTLGSENITRAFFDQTAAAEPWENEITTLCVYAFDQSGNSVIKRNLTSAEIAAKSVRFALPKSTAGTSCSFYIVANTDYGTVATAAAMDARSEAIALSEYNGAASTVMSGRTREAGFVMTGKTNATIAPSGSSTNVAVTLKRLVAKVAVKTTLSDDFKNNYNGGSVVITSAEISRANAVSYSFPQTPSAKTSMYTHTQQSNPANNSYGNLFYIYGNNVLASDNDKVLLTLNGYFDADGNEATTGDRSDVQYKVLMDGNGRGEIKANGYYRIEANIKGLSGDGVTLTFTVANWETPVTQNVELGI